MTLPYRDVQRILYWTSTKIGLLQKVNSASSRKVRRGQVYWCEFGENIGSEQCKKRPALILQNDPANETSPNTIVAPITSQESKNSSVYHLDRPTDSMVTGYVLLGNVVTVSKARLGDYIDKLSSKELEGVEEALFNSLGVIGKIHHLRDHLHRTLIHLEKVKTERNHATDTLKEIKAALEIPENGDKLTILKQLGLGKFY